MHLPEKKKAFSQFLSPFLEFGLNSEHFENRDGTHSLCISEITYCERGG